MDDHPHWNNLTLSDRVRLVALECEVEGCASTLTEVLHEAADALESAAVKAQNDYFARPQTRQGEAMPKMVSRDAVGVFVSNNGYVCICREDAAGDEIEIALEPGQVLTVIRWMQDALPQATALFKGIEDDGASK